MTWTELDISKRV